MKKLLLISLFTLLTANTAWSNCREANEPALPNGDWIDEQELLQTQEDVKRYIAAQELFLSCVKNKFKHNAAIDRMREVAEKYNDMAKRYKSRIKSIDIFTELAMSTDQY